MCTQLNFKTTVSYTVMTNNSTLKKYFFIKKSGTKKKFSQVEKVTENHFYNLIIHLVHIILRISI